VSNIKSYFKKNSDNYSIHTKHSNDLHLSQTNLSIYHKGVYHSGVKIFHNFPSEILLEIWKDLKELYDILWLHTLSTLWRNTIPDDTCGICFNFNFYFHFYSILNYNFIQCCINLSTMFILTLFVCTIITSCSVVLLWHFVPLVFFMYYGCFWFACFHAFILYMLQFRHPIALFLIFVRLY